MVLLHQLRLPLHHGQGLPSPRGVQRLIEPAEAATLQALPHLLQQAATACARGEGRAEGRRLSAALLGQGGSIGVDDACKRLSPLPFLPLPAAAGGAKTERPPAGLAEAAAAAGRCCCCRAAGASCCTAMVSSAASRCLAFRFFFLRSCLPVACSFGGEFWAGIGCCGLNLFLRPCLRCLPEGAASILAGGGLVRKHGAPWSRLRSGLDRSVAGANGQ